MIGAIIGDIAGSRFEFNNTKSADFDLLTNDCFFTDDTVCTVAIADALMNPKNYANSYANAVVKYCRQYPGRGYGGMFARWITSPVPYNSFGNGAVMRISAIPLLCRNLTAVHIETNAATEISHNHPDGLLYADVVSVCIFNLKNGMPKQQALEQALLNIGLDEMPEFEDYKNPFDETVYNCVPAALYCLQESTDFESAIRKAIIIGGDVDTIGACVGGMAEALYGVSRDLFERAMSYLPDQMKSVINQFYAKYEKE